MIIHFLEQIHNLLALKMISPFVKVQKNFKQEDIIKVPSIQILDHLMLHLNNFISNLKKKDPKKN